MIAKEIQAKDLKDGDEVIIIWYERNFAHGIINSISHEKYSSTFQYDRAFTFKNDNRQRTICNSDYIYLINRKD